jgi:hypothetical protein
MLQTIKEIWESCLALGGQFYVNIKTTVATTRLGHLENNILW